MAQVEVEFLTCPICLEVPEAEIYQCTNGHSICASCLNKTSACPQCKVDWGEGEGEEQQKIRNRALEELIANSRIPCQHKEEGCAELVLRKELSAHADSCEFRPIKLCSIMGMTSCSYGSWKGSELFQHIESEHNTSSVKGWSYDKSMKKHLKCMRRHVSKNGVLLFEIETESLEEEKEEEVVVVEKAEPFRFLIHSKVSISSGDFTLSCLHFGDNNGNSSAVSSKCFVTIDVSSEVMKTKWSWTGHPVHFKRAEDEMSMPPVKVPIKKLINLFRDVDPDLCYRVTFHEN